MLLWLTENLANYYSGFNVFQYLTLRTILGVLTSLLIALIVGPYLIKRLGEHQIGQSIRKDGPESHVSKSGTPTMGGLLILLAVFAPTLLWARLSNPFVWLALGVMLAFGLIGFVDDLLKYLSR